MEDLDCSYTALLVGMQDVAGSLENSLACSQMAKHRLTTLLSNSAARIISKRKRTYIHIKTCVQMFIMTLLVIVKKWKLQRPIS